MAIIHLPNGIGETLGDSLATTSPLELNGNVWYVHYGTGTDAVSPAGQNRQAPLKTLSQAQTNATGGDIIVLMDGHEETFAAALAITKDLTIIGAGSSGGLPTVKLTNNSAAASMLSITTNNLCQLRNIWFEEQAQACSAPKISINTANGFVIISGCYFQAGQYDDDTNVYIAAAGLVNIKNTTFISTATSVATQPHSAIDVAAAAVVRAVILDGVVVNGGTYGWSNYHAVDLNGNAITFAIAENLSLLLGSDMAIYESCAGYVNPSTRTGGCRIDWDGVT